MQIHTVGWYGHHNVGDESYKLSFPIVFPNHSFTFSDSVEGVKADAYILGGGDVVHGPYLKCLKDVHNKHIMSATISNMVDIKDFKSIAVRDLRSMELAKKNEVEATLVPDFAFALTPNPERGKQIINEIFAAEKAEIYTKVIVVTINGFLLPSEKTPHREAIAFQTLAYELGSCFDKICASFIFVPFGTKMPSDDRIANAWVSTKCKFWQKNVTVFDRLSVQDTLDIVAGSDGVISTRLHSSIFSCLCGVPFIDITHNHKNESFLDTIGFKKYCNPFRGFSSMKFVEDLTQILNGDEQSCKELSEIASNYKSNLLQYSDTINKVLS